MLLLETQHRLIHALTLKTATFSCTKWKTDVFCCYCCFCLRMFYFLFLEQENENQPFSKAFSNSLTLKKTKILDFSFHEFFEFSNKYQITRFFIFWIPFLNGKSNYQTNTDSHGQKFNINVSVSRITNTLEKTSIQAFSS